MTSKKINILGFIALIPLIITASLLLLSLGKLLQISEQINKQHGDSDLLGTQEMLHYFAPLLPWYVIGAFFITMIWLYFLIVCIKDNSATENDKLIWALILLFFNIIGLPLYWYFRIYQNSDFGFEPKITDRTN